MSQIYCYQLIYHTCEEDAEVSLMVREQKSARLNVSKHFALHVIKQCIKKSLQCLSKTLEILFFKSFHMAQNGLYYSLINGYKTTKRTTRK